MAILQFEAAKAQAREAERRARAMECAEEELLEFFEAFGILKQQANKTVLYRGLLEDVEALINQKMKQTHFVVSAEHPEGVLKEDTLKELEKRGDQLAAAEEMMFSQFSDLDFLEDDCSVKPFTLDEWKETRHGWAMELLLQNPQPPQQD